MPHRLQAVRALSRRELLARAANGFGAIALAALLRESGYAAGGALTALHHRPRARRVIFLYMDGGVSQVDSFDPKPRLEAENGRPFALKIEPTQFNNIGTTLRSLWTFRRYGQSGIEISDLFPRLGAAAADDLCVVRSLVSQFSEHQTANYYLHSCFGMQGRPSAGAWISYGLGSENQNLPAYVVLNGGLIPSGGIDCFGSSFLPATHQATIFKPQKHAIANIAPLERSPSSQQRKLRLLRRLDELALAAGGGPEAAIEGAIANYEMAARMQLEVPELMDVEAQESAATRHLYGLEAEFEPTRIFGRQCLIARRLVERGVRFVELTCPRSAGNDRWDAHSNLWKNHGENARAVDQPMAALLRDLRDRGLLEDTLVVWAGEFGRTPFAQGGDGRDHSPFGFSVWLAGGGVRGGTVYGRTDDYGYKVVEGKVEMFDLHATILHLLGVDHERLTFRFGGRDMRLTDVHGEVIHALLA